MNQNGKTPSFWPLILPFLVFMVFTMFEPKFSDQHANDRAEVENLEATAGDIVETSPEANSYFTFYSLKIAVVAALLLVFFKSYLRHFPFRVTWWSVGVGLAGGILWIGLCYLSLESRLAARFRLPASWFETRSGINPAEHYAWMWPLLGFYIVRFTGLVVIVPIMEEMFLRGFVVRYLEDVQWWKVRFRNLDWIPILAPTVYGVLTHQPSEFLAAAAWFSLITWLMLKTGKFWDCVVAHAITNLMLGIYVVAFEQWQWW